MVITSTITNLIRLQLYSGDRFGLEVTEEAAEIVQTHNGYALVLATAKRPRELQGWMSRWQLVAPKISEIIQLSSGFPYVASSKELEEIPESEAWLVLGTCSKMEFEAPLQALRIAYPEIQLHPTNGTSWACPQTETALQLVEVGSIHTETERLTVAMWATQAEVSARWLNEAQPPRAVVKAMLFREDVLTEYRSKLLDLRGDKEAWLEPFDETVSVKVRSGLHVKESSYQIEQGHLRER